MDGCVSYFNQTTQYDIPERQLNRYQTAKNPSATVIDPANNWVVTPNATEYDCIGLNIVPVDPNDLTQGFTTSYKTTEEWIDTWAQGGCVDLFRGMILGLNTTQNTQAFSINNFYLVQDDFNFMFSRFFNQDDSTQYIGPTGPCSDITLATAGQTGGKFSNADNNCNVWIGNKNALVTPGGAGVIGSYNSFSDTLLSACKDLPGACAQMQQYMCGECSRDDVVVNPVLVQFCGCSIAQSSGGNSFYNNSMSNFDPSCDPLCNRIDTVKLVDTTTGVANVCNSSVCVIDSVTINSISSTGVEPTFNQVCPACANGKGNCICIIDATFENTITSVKGNDGTIIDNNIKFTQYCPNSQCFIADPKTGLFQQVECASRLPKGTGPEAQVPWWVIAVAIIIIIFALIIIFAYRYTVDSVKVYQTKTQYYNIPFVSSQYTNTY
jgi:hypothetical protein